MFGTALKGGLLAISHSDIFLIYCDTDYICGQALGCRMFVERVNHPAHVKSLIVCFPGVI